MKKSLVILTIGILVLTLLFLILKPSFTGYSVYDNFIEKNKLGYCPTMQDEAISLSKEKGYELIQFGSASEVLHALKNGQINKAIIGRKAEKTEISLNTKETILKSGYTLASNKKGFIDYSELPSIEMYTYSSNEVVSGLIPVSSKIIYNDKTEVLKKIQESKITLISWDDWDDDFEPIVVMEGNEKVKDFRGVFLYEI